MSDHFSGYRSKQLRLRHYSTQNVMPRYSPFAFNRPRNNYHLDRHFSINGLHEQHLLHQPNNYLAEIPPPTPNLRIGMWGRGGAKAYFRFHGGIGDGCGGVAGRMNTEVNASSRPLQLFESLISIDFQIGMIKKAVEGGFVQNPVIGMPGFPVEASGGTGVFFPAYPKRIRASKGKRARGGHCGSWQPCCGGHCGGWQPWLGGHCGGWQPCPGVRMEQEDIFTKTLVGGNVMEAKECEDIEDIPIELLLPAEWPY